MAGIAGKWGLKTMARDLGTPDKPLMAVVTQAQLGDLPDQRGVRSWAFEPYLELHHQAACAELGPVLDDLRDHWMQGLQRKPNPVRQSNFVDCLRVILLNLMRVRTGTQICKCF